MPLKNKWSRSSQSVGYYYRMWQKTASNYFSNNFVKQRSILISFGTRVV